MKLNANIPHIFVETTIAFLFLFILTRIVGKKQLAQLTYFNYVAGITVGSIAASMAVDKSINTWEGITALVTWTLFTFAAEVLTVKFAWLKGPLQSKPSILIKHGNIDRKEMQKNRLNLEELTMLLRNKNTFSIADVEVAVLETNGSLTVIKRSEQQTPTRKDFNFDPLPTALAVPVIVDGKPMTKNLTDAGIDLKWLENQLKAQKISSFQDVFYAEIQPNGELFIDKLDSSS